MSDPRKPIFDAIRTAKAKSLRPEEVIVIDELLDSINIPRAATPIGRRINAAGLDLIKSSEGCELKAYKDAVGVWTIGYGSTGSHVKPGMTITQAQAEELLRSDLRRFEDAVAEYCQVATDNQFAAMVSLAFNVGEENFRTSTLRRLHNAGDHAGAQAQFARWNKAGGRVLSGLVTRRANEAALYGRSA